MTNSVAGRELSLMAAVNTVIDDLHGSLGLANSDYFCECDRIGCMERMTLTRAEYASLREEARPVIAAAHAHRESSAALAAGGTTIGHAPPIRLRLRPLGVPSSGGSVTA
jgi:hypothetical protein